MCLDSCRALSRGNGATCSMGMAVAVTQHRFTRCPLWFWLQRHLHNNSSSSCSMTRRRAAGIAESAGHAAAMCNDILAPICL